MTSKTDKRILKLLSLGGYCVGKSSFIERSITNKYRQQHVTNGIDFMTKNMKIKENNVIIRILDAPGAEYFKQIVQRFQQSADGFFVSYSVIDRQSFEQITYWIHGLMEQCDNWNQKTVLIGNKCDCKERAVSESEGKELARQYNIPFFETSAINGTNCSEALTALVLRCLEQPEKVQKFFEIDNSNNIKLSSSIKHSSKEKSQC